jgi:acyl dehydratase
VIAALERTITLTDMVAYAGATWDWHPLHYDGTFVAQKKLPGPVVDGQMLGALMAEQVLDHFGPRAFITALSFRFRAMVYAGDTVRVEGSIAEQDDASARVRQRVLVGDRLAAEGEATVRL